MLHQSWSTGWNEKYLNGSTPWRIDPTTHRTMSERSYHRATSRSPDCDHIQKRKTNQKIKKSRIADKCEKFSSMVVKERLRTLASASSCSRTCTSVELVLGSCESLVSSLSSPSIRLACSSSYTVHAPYILSTRWDRSSDAARMFPHRCWIDSSSRGMFGNSIR